MKLEIIATRPEDALAAERGGADRIELVSGMLEGGLTPSIGLIEAVAEQASIPVRVMIRPHSLGFRYDRAELAVMRADIRAVRRTRAAGIVLGALTAEGTIDAAALELLLGEAEHLSVTFHRAFDEARDLEEALATLAGYSQIDRILTSGGRPTAPEAVPELRRLVQASAGTGIEILAGSGIDGGGLAALVLGTGVTEVHAGSSVRVDRHPLRQVVPERVRELRDILDRLEQERPARSGGEGSQPSRS
ncbi:copper homeostasis protein CutC [Paenibacillus albicereus]|uniref:PF03932 family protein CutC n=1 Tax=Paenibacillus albicereus TaxID=2726185 RepID=A0A6H2GTL7_9BACL|nr:copper homeostasis protein CutC [Paenibacillus albicereus]QJC50750.1 copper homeostasis protein CutC [Paenibacillus albicereus]